METLFDVRKVEDGVCGEWMTLTEKSEQTTPFIDDDYLEAVGYTSDKYVVMKKGEPCMGVCIPIEKETGAASGIVPYAPYQGLLYADSRPEYSDYHKNLEATDFLLDYLYEHSGLKHISFGNSYMLNDLRAVQWHHYHNSELGMYDLRIRYTAVKYLNEGNIVDGLSKGRKLDYRYSRERYGVQCIRSYDTGDFINLYERTFLRQGIVLSDKEMEKVKRIVDTMMRKDIGELWYAIDGDGRCIDATFILYEGVTGYYLFGANEPDYRKCGGATLLLVEQMMAMKERGIEVFDFLGVNSPQRGDFKLSFGAKLKPYYICTVDY